VVVRGGPGVRPRIAELTDREALAELIAGLGPQGMVSVQRSEDPNAYAMAGPIEDGRFRVWYQDGPDAATTDRVNSAGAAEALHDWAVRAENWEAGFRWEHSMPVPDRIPITHEPGYRTDLIGHFDGGMFFAGYCGQTYLHLFDHDGNHVRSHIGRAEQEVGTDDVTASMARLRERVAALPGHRFGDIAVRLFCVEHDGKRWGLFDETAEFGRPHVEMRPDWLGFHPPWNGLYDT
jgi:formate hydrogenlyase regulatory protein HycA